MQRLLGTKQEAVLQCAAAMLRLHAAACGQEDAEHPVWAIKDKYCDDRWHAVSLQPPLSACRPVGQPITGQPISGQPITKQPMAGQPQPA